MPGGKRSLLVVGSFLAGVDLSRYPSAELARRLAMCGWRVTLTSRHRGRLRRLADMSAMVWRMRHDYEVALVDVFSGPAFRWAECCVGLARRLGKTVVLTLRGGHLPEFAQRHPGRIRRLLNRAHVVTTPSRYLQEAMRPYRTDLRLIPNALDVGLYGFRQREQPSASLIWLRAFERTYNPTLACQVVSLLTAEHPQVQLTMIGPDKGDGSLARVKAEIRRLKLEGRVELPGPVAKGEVPRVLNVGDVFLNTTNVDNTPVSVIEAMACGLCVVSTNVGGVPFLIEHERDGLLVPIEDAPAMAAAVKRVLTEPGLAERFSRNARAKAEGFDWSAVLPQWEKLLESVIA